MSPIWQASIVALWVFTLFIGLLLIGTLRQLGLIQLRLGPDPGGLITDVGLDRGTHVPDFEAFDAESRKPVRFHDLPGVPRAVVLISPTCMTCHAVVKALNEVMAVRDDFDFLVICREAVGPCVGFGEMHQLRARMWVDPTGDVERTLEVSLTPFVYVLDAAGRVLIRGVANDIRSLESLLDQEGTLQGGRPWVEVEEGELVDGRAGR